MIKNYVALLSFCFLFNLIHGQGSQEMEGDDKRWSVERINEWYGSLDWPVGANYVPAYAINQLEMWQKKDFDPVRIDLELGWAEELGFNTMRVFLHHLLWEEDAEGFLDRIDTYLELADKHGIKTMIVLLDDVWHPLPELGPQPAPIPHVHNSGWVQSPGKVLLTDLSRHDELAPYIKGVMSHFKNDPRVLTWDLYNEPGNGNGNSYGKIEPKDKGRYSLALLKKVYQWAREVNPSQPLSIDVWTSIHKEFDQMSKIDQFAYSHSDLINFHAYANARDTERMVQRLAKSQRPLFCTEYMARTVNSTFEEILPIFKKHKVAAYNWGFVNGKSQTIYPWDSWNKQYTDEPKLWFHDVLRKNGKPYKNEEVEFIKNILNVKPTKKSRKYGMDIQKARAPLYRDPVFDGAADPSVIWDKYRQQWTVFYTQRRASQKDLKGVEFCYGTAIGMAVSNDKGVNWNYLGQANIPGPDEGLNSFWAPQVVKDKERGLYHMFVTYIKGVYTDWGGERQLYRYTSYDLINWKFEEKLPTEGCIDASVYQLDDGSWKMWYKDEKKGALTYTAISKDLTNWELTNIKEGGDIPHEAPVVFKWKESYWMMTDKWGGIEVYRSSNGSNWKYSTTILREKGLRPDDNDYGRHPDVVIVNDQAFIVYFTHPGRRVIDNKEQEEESYRYRRSSFQIAELEYNNGKISCDRNKYYPYQNQ